MTSQRQEIQRSAGELLKSGRFDGDACVRIVDALKKIAEADERATPHVACPDFDAGEVTLRERAWAAGIGVTTVSEAVPAVPARKKQHPMA